MSQVGDVLHAKFGKVDEAVELFKNFPNLPAAYTQAKLHFNVMTDISGPMYTLVNEFATETIGEWERLIEQIYAMPDYQSWFKQFQLYIEGGRREYYHVEGMYENWSRPGVMVVRQAYRAYKWQIQQAVSLMQRYGALLVDRNVGLRPRILTDASGQMFQAIIEIETESMSAWEEHRRSLFQQPAFQVWFVQMTNAVEAGAHEFYRVEHTPGA